MENMNNALSDVERNKELFEYEMTEVILQLKGEFVKFSGKDLDYEYPQVSILENSAGTGITNVKISNISVEMQDVKKFLNENFVIPFVKIGKTNIDCPTSQAVKDVVFKNLTIEGIQLDFQAVNVNVKPNTDLVKIELPVVSETKSNITVPILKEINSSDVISKINVFTSPVLKSFAENLPAIELNRTVFDILETKFNINSDFKVPSEYASVSIPDIPLVSHYSDITVYVDTDLKNSEVFKTDIPEVKEYVPQYVNVLIPLLDSLDTSLKLNTQNTNCAVENIKVFLPDVLNTKSFVPKEVHLEKKKTDLPDVRSVNIEKLKQVKIDNIILDSQVEKSDIKSNCYVGTTINVNKTNIDIEYPTVNSISLPKINLEKIIEPEVPEIFDFNEAIKSVLESAV